MSQQLALSISISAPEAIALQPLFSFSVLSSPDQDLYAPDYDLDTDLDHLLFTDEEWSEYEASTKFTPQDEERLEREFQDYLEDRLGRYGY